MRIKTGDMTDASQINLDQTRNTREVSDSSASGVTAANKSQGSDSIALSGISDLVSQAQSAGSDARAARVQQLKQLIESNQYPIDPVAVSRALISAHVAGD